MALEKRAFNGARTRPCLTAAEGYCRLRYRMILVPVLVFLCCYDGAPVYAREGCAPLCGASGVAAHMAAAKELLRQGKAALVITTLRGDHLRNPHDRNVSVLLAQAYIQAGDRGAAIGLLQGVLAVYPDDAGARLALATAYAFNRDYADAEIQYRGILVVHPNDVDARLGLGRTLAFLGNYEEAQAMYASVLERDRKDVDAWVGLGAVDMYSGNYVAAKADYGSALKVDTGNVDALVGLAMIALAADELAPAASLLHRALIRSPNDADALEAKHELDAKLAPLFSLVSFGAEYSDGRESDRSFVQRYWLTPSTQLGVREDRYTLDSRNISVQASRLGLTGRYAAAPSADVELTLTRSQFARAKPSSDLDFSFSGRSGHSQYSVGYSAKGVDPRLAVNSGRIAPSTQTPDVRISGWSAEFRSMEPRTSVGLTAQSASYNDGNRFHEAIVFADRRFTVAGSSSLTLTARARSAGFKDSYTQVGGNGYLLSHGYYDYLAQRDLEASALFVRSIGPHLRASFSVAVGVRETEVAFQRYAQARESAPFSTVGPFFEYQNGRLELSASGVFAHYAANTYAVPYNRQALRLDLGYRL